MSDVTVSDALAAGLAISHRGDLDMGSYDIGDGIKLTAEFTNDVGAPADPTTVVCTMKKPDASITTLSTTNPQVGTYVTTIVADQAGRHHYRFVGSGALSAAQEGSFTVRRQKVA